MRGDRKTHEPRGLQPRHWLKVNSDWVTFCIYWNHVCQGEGLSICPTKSFSACLVYSLDNHVTRQRNSFLLEIPTLPKGLWTTHQHKCCQHGFHFFFFFLLLFKGFWVHAIYNDTIILHMYSAHSVYSWLCAHSHTILSPFVQLLRMREAVRCSQAEALQPPLSQPNGTFTAPLNLHLFY